MGGADHANFSASGLQAIADESWGLDNVKVDASNLPYATPADCGTDCPPPKTNLNQENPRAVGGNPGGQNASANPVRYFDGSTLVGAVDLASFGFGTNFGQGRTWTNEGIYADLLSTSPQAGRLGTGWVLSQQPWLMQDGDTVAAIMGLNQVIFFDAVSGGYQARFFLPDTLQHDDTDHTFVLADSSGNRITFRDFSSFTPTSQQGQFLSLTDPAGNVTAVTSTNADGTIAEIQRTDAATGLTESYLYTYVTSGPNAGRLSNVTLRRQTSSSGPWETVRQVDYVYYDGVEDYGNAGDLKTATVRDADGNALDTFYYRYYTASDAGSVGYVHGLKYVFNPESFDRLVAAVGDPFTATDAQVSPFADNAFQYDSLHRVTQEVVQGEGCSCTSGGGLGTYTFSYETGAFPDGYNTWRYKTTETLPDGNSHIVYSNVFGEVMLFVFHDASTNQDWISFTKFDDAGRINLVAAPSAVSGFNESTPDLLHFDNGNYQFLNDNAGLIQTVSYFLMTTADDTNPGGVAGYVQSVSLQRGEFGAPVLQSSTTYFLHNGGGATVAPVATSTVYRNQASFNDAGFELPFVGTGSYNAFAYNPGGSAWTFNSGSGVAGNGSGFTSGNPDSPQGTQVGFLQSVGSSISQSVYFDAGTYTVSFLAAQRGNTQPGGNQSIQVLIDGNVVSTFTPSGTSYASLTTANFTVTAGPHTLTFEGLTGGDSTAFIDQVKVNAVDGAQTTTFEYTFFADSTRVQSVATTLPVISASQNGPGTPDISATVYNVDGRPIWLRDASGFLTYLQYDKATGALVKMIQDVDTTQTGDFTDLPTGWSTPAGGGLHLVSTMEVDALGRTVRSEDPNHNVTYTVYNDPNHEVRVYAGWDSTTNRPTGPTVVYREDRPGSYFETLTMSAAPDVDGSGRPTGTEPISDIQTLSRTYISIGGQLDHVDDYFFLGTFLNDAGFETPNVGTGTYSAFAYNPAGSPWTFTGGAGVAGNGSGFTSGNPDAPQGTQVGFLQDAGSTVSQAVAFAAGTYVISFLAAQRGNYQPAGNQTIDVLVDGAVVGTFTPTGTGYGSYSTTAFAVTAGTHIVAFVGRTAGDSTAFLDQVSIQQVSVVTPGDAGFEVPDVGTGTSAYVGHPTGTAWTFAGSIPDAYGTASDPDTDKSGVAGNGSGFTSGNANAPEGTQVAFLQGTSTISQALTLAAGTYTVNFLAAQRANYQASYQSFEVRIDSNAVGTFTPGGTSYSLLTTGAFTVTAGTHTLEFIGLNPNGGDNTVFLDGVSLYQQLDSNVHYSTAPELGAVNVNFYRTVYGHDDRGRINAIVTPNGTIYRTVYDALGRVDSTWVGTDDMPLTGDDWAPDNNGGNMVQVSAYVYDNGGVGDSNLTQVTLFPGGSEAPRVFTNLFDWRDRWIAGKSGVQDSEDTTTHRPILYVVLDNLGEAVEVRRYDGDGVNIVDANNDGVPDLPAAGLLRALLANEFDDQGRAFRTHAYSVDPTDGTVSAGSLTSNFYFDHRGFLIATSQPGGLWIKDRFDGAWRNTVSYVTDGGSGTDWVAANTIDDDIVLEQTEYERDANGNAILVTYRQRFHDEIATGALGDPSSGPLARVYFVANYFDALDRLVTSVNVGTNGGTAYIRPATPDARSDTSLRSDYLYNAAGWLEFMIDPRGIASRMLYDNLGRTNLSIQAFTNGIPTDNTDRSTAFGYDGNDNVLSVSARLPGGSVQTTGYVYGVATVGGIHSNDLLVAMQYPDKSSGLPSADEEVTYTYNQLGEVTSMTDRNGTTHTYQRDVLGRVVADIVTTLGAGVDGSVRRLDTAYDSQGNAFLFTSYADVEGTTVVNQVLRQFNGLGQLVAEYQSHDGPVDTNTTPVVRYGYSEMPGGANHSRLVSITYPNGRVVNFNYASGVDGTISRLSSISDSSGTLEAYAYLGLGTVVRRSHPQPGVDLTYIKLPSEGNGDAGDPYKGLDRFGRIGDQRWLNAATLEDLDRFFYEYDRNSNRTAKLNVLNGDLDEFYAYDLLDQLTNFARGSHTQSWDMDGQGNFTSVTKDGDTEDREHNAQNQLTQVGGNTLTFDANGNLTTDEQGRTLIWDAWNRLVEVRDGSTTLLRHAYDAHGWRITADDGTTVREFFFSAGWQVLEERVDGQAEVQYVWSPVYVDAMILRDRDTNGDGSLDERLYPTQDANFNVTTLVDASGNVVERIVPDPYGKVTFYDADWNVLPASDFEWKHTHQGLRFESVVGLFDNRDRWYSPTLMRFVSNDRDMYDGTNLYGAYRNGPVNKVDPTGEWLWVAAGGIIGGIIGGVQAYRRGENVWLGAAKVAAVGVVVTATGGLAGGLAAKAGAGVIVSGIVAGGTGSAAGSVTQQLLHNGRVDPRKVGKDALIGGATGGLISAAPLAVNAIRNIPPPTGGLVLAGAAGPNVAATAIPQTAVATVPAAAGTVPGIAVVYMSAPEGPPCPNTVSARDLPPNAAEVAQRIPRGAAEGLKRKRPFQNLQGTPGEGLPRQAPPGGRPPVYEEYVIPGEGNARIIRDIANQRSYYTEDIHAKPTIYRLIEE